jgi:hypothetical protein
MNGFFLTTAEDAEVSNSLPDFTPTLSLWEREG